MRTSTPRRQRHRGPSNIIAMPIASIVLVLLFPHRHLATTVAFRPPHHPQPYPRRRGDASAKLRSVPEIHDVATAVATGVFPPAPMWLRALEDTLPLPPSSLSPSAFAAAPSLLASDGGGETWRQYVPLAVSGGVIIDILLGSPLANLVLAPMKRASEKGAGGNGDGDEVGGRKSSLFSGSAPSGRSPPSARERVDSEAIAQAALDKANNTLELKRFLEDKKTDEMRYDEMRQKINRQLDDFE